MLITILISGTCDKKQTLRPVHTRELALATSSRNMLLEQSSLVCTNNFMRKKLLRNNIFAPGFCSIESNWLIMREQAPGANLLQQRVEGASSLVCIGLYALINIIGFLEIDLQDTPGDWFQRPWVIPYLLSTPPCGWGV